MHGPLRLKNSSRSTTLTPFGTSQNAPTPAGRPFTGHAFRTSGSLRRPGRSKTFHRPGLHKTRQMGKPDAKEHVPKVMRLCPQIASQSGLFLAPRSHTAVFICFVFCGLRPTVWLVIRRARAAFSFSAFLRCTIFGAIPHSTI